MLSRLSPPAILHVCRESREEALKYYILEFGASKEVDDFVITSRPKIYVNPSVDAVCLPRPETFQNIFTANTEYSNYDPESKARQFGTRAENIQLKSVAINVSIGRSGI